MQDTGLDGYKSYVCIATPINHTYLRHKTMGMYAVYALAQ